MKRIKIAYGQGVSFKQEVQKYLTAYRNTPHSITGKTPAEMLFGRKLRTKIPHVRDIYDDIETRDRDAEQKQQRVEARNSGKRGHDIAVGSLVLLLRDKQTKCMPPYHREPYTVREVSGPMLVLESRDGRVVRRNVTFVRPYFLPNDCVVDGDICGTNNDGGYTRYGNNHRDGIPICASGVPELDRNNSDAVVRDGSPPASSPVSEATTPNSRRIATDTLPDRPVRDRRPPPYLQEYTTK
jgi:hypothetical protein